ncbi:MAG: hypothetical protein R1F54_06965 [Candidatus Zeuxoniibacter abyssi]|nr:MAG: hypothetical protein R1F54_06965 [Candidatus Persebacteraceae bacterium AB1(2)]
MNKPKAKPKPRPIKMELTSMDIAAQKRAELTALLKRGFRNLSAKAALILTNSKECLAKMLKATKSVLACSGTARPSA